MARFSSEGSAVLSKKNRIMTNSEIKVGDRVQWNDRPQVKSEVVKIEESEFLGCDIYHLKNNCQFQLHEITKIK